MAADLLLPEERPEGQAPLAQIPTGAKFTCEGLPRRRYMPQAENEFTGPCAVRRRRPRLAQQGNQLTEARSDTTCVSISEDAQHAKLSHETACHLLLHGSGRRSCTRELFRSGLQGRGISERQSGRMGQRLLVGQRLQISGQPQGTGGHFAPLCYRIRGRPGTLTSDGSCVNPP